MKSLEVSEFKGFRTGLRTLDELIRLVELRLGELERRISRLEARARGAPDLILRFEDQDPNCQDKSCGNAPLGCAVKRYCPREEV